jgi:Flp pilus assembly protein CpaB
MAQGSRARGRIFIYLALVIILALVLVYVFLIRGGTALTKTNTAPLPTATLVSEMVDIVISQQAIPQGTTISADFLATIKYPKRELVEGTFFNKIDEVVGKVAKIDLDARVPLTHSLIIEATEGSYKAVQIPKGMVAVSIPVKDRISYVSFLPQAGDHVSVIVSLLYVDLDTNFQTRLPNFTAAVTAPGPAGDKAAAGLTASIAAGGEGSAQGRAELDPTLNQPLYVVPSELKARSRLVSQTILPDARILQVGEFVKPAPVQAQQTGPTPTPIPGATPVVAPSIQPDVITLVVTPQDAVTLNYLVFSGAQLSLVLRGAGDDQRVQTEAVTMQYLMDQYNIPLPTKLPYGFEQRMDILHPSEKINIVTPK